MKQVAIGCFGLAGHQILGYITGLRRARLAAVGGMTPSEIQRIKADFPDVAVFSDLDRMLEEGGVDLLSFCCTPRTEQTLLAIKALNAGKHVLVEKPIATTMDDLEKIRQAAAVSSGTLRTMTPMPYGGHFTGMKRVIAAGALGTIVQIYAMKSYPYHDSRPQDRDVDGGIILQAGIHAVSFIRYVTGLEFVQVFAQDTGAGNPGEGELQMGANMTFRMNNGALAVILCNYCNPPGIGYHGNDQLRVHGADGMIELVDGTTRRMLVVKDEEPRAFDNVTPEMSYPQDFISHILDGTPTLLSQEDSFRNTEVVLRAQESAARGVPLKI